ncbi:MAG: hypothetical protein ACHRHE_09850 [Tepidisphaerales bacterium]
MGTSHIKTPRGQPRHPAGTPAPPLLALVTLLFSAISTFAAQPPALAPHALLQRALAGPLHDTTDIVFCSRSAYNDPHWYANIGYYCDDANDKAYAGNGKPDAGRLYKLNLHTGQTTTLLDPKGGSVRDPQVYYDGNKIIFSYRPTGTDYYHLYEINIDGSALRQLTTGDFDDIEPTYLPDGDIVFISTRCKRWVNCWMTQVAVMYRCDATGGRITQISSNTEHDNTPWVMPDGRLLYTRWEYVDRSQVEYHHLWTMNPDGTGQQVFYGNMHSWTVMIDAKPIPGTQKVLASFSPGHGVNEHAGYATIVSGDNGPDDPAAPKPLHKGGLTRDPYPLSADLFLMARNNQLVLMDDQNHEEILYSDPTGIALNEPRPIQPRPREPVIPSRLDPKEPTGRMVLADVYMGRNMPGVERGQIKKLLILESLPKPVNFSGGPDLVSWLGTFTLERVLGTVPVEPDGSAYFEVPARRQVFFVALDDKDMSVKRMQSFTTVMPGEVLSCAGCHEERNLAPRHKSEGTLMAMRRPPSRIQPFAGYPDVLDFQRDIQPILNRYCVECHRPEKHEGHMLLTGDRGPTYSHAYISLLAHRVVTDGRNGLGNQPPRSIGSSASPLLAQLSKHKATERDWRTAWLWIESGAPYAGSYAGLRNKQQQEAGGLANGAVFGPCNKILQARCGSCHEVAPNVTKNERPIPFNDELRHKQPQIVGHPTGSYERLVIAKDPMGRYSHDIIQNFTRPELSAILLAPLAKSAGGWGNCGEVFKDRNDPDYKTILAALRRGQEILDREPRYGAPGFKPNPQYIREMMKYGILPAAFDPAKETVSFFDLDQKYWRSSWYQP